MVRLTLRRTWTAAAKYAFAACALCAMATPASAAGDDEALINYFSARLNGSEEAFLQNIPVELSQIEAQQDAVWQAWVKANEALDEERLIPLDELSLKKNSSWTLPAKLENNAVMNYYYGKKGARPEAGYPLFLYLHGSGDKNNEWANGIKFGNSFEDGPSVYFIPQIPNTGDYYRWWQKGKQWAWEKLLRQLYLTGDIDPNRIYFFGISEGGYGSQRLASYYGDYLAGAGPMAGGEPLKNAPVENCRNLAFNFRTGADDTGFFRNELTQATKDAFEAAQKKYPDGFVHHIELIPGKGHQIDYTKTTPWLAQYTRNPQPKHVIWENFEMDGIYRKGFANICVEEDPRGEFDTYRITYFMDIEGNEITLASKKTVYNCTETENGIDKFFKKFYANLNKGKIRLYLSPKLVDFNQPVKITANGKVLFNGMLQPTVQDMANSLATFYDPERIFPASVVIDFASDGTGIAGVEMDEAKDGHYYDLAGKMTTQPQNGVYITSNGKKVMF